MQQRAAEYGENDDSDPSYLKSSKQDDPLTMELAELIPEHVLSADEFCHSPATAITQC